jgi:hypothetical protein
MRRGRRLPGSCRHDGVDGPDRPSGRNAVPTGTTRSTITSPARCTTGPWTEIRLRARAHTISSANRPHAPPGQRRHDPRISDPRLTAGPGAQPAGTDARRDRLLADIPTRSGFDRDEYPPSVGRGKGKGLERGATRAAGRPTWPTCRAPRTGRTAPRCGGRRLGAARLMTRAPRRPGRTRARSSPETVGPDPSSERRTAATSAREADRDRAEQLTCG